MKTIIRTLSIATLSLVTACGLEPLTDPEYDGGEDAGVVLDVGEATRDTGSNDPDPDPDLGSPDERDMGAPEDDMGQDPMETDMGMGEEDMGMEEPEVWPEHSGTACDVDGVPGVCLPTSRCGGRSVPGHCPGPSDMQCCLAGCDMSNGDAGRCTTTGACSSGAQTSNMCEGPSGDVVCCPAPDGDPIGELWITYYYLSVEDDFSGADDTTLYDSSCNPLAQVPASFSDAACIEGSARLENGTVINYSSRCSCGRPCPTGGTVCWTEVDPNRFPWGQGARANALEPLRSLAVDRDFIALGTSIYMPDWDGYSVPRVGDVGGFVHDGCFEAADVGGAIDGNHIDVFSGTSQMRQTLEGVFPTRTRFQAFTNHPKCP